MAELAGAQSADLKVGASFRETRCADRRWVTMEDRDLQARSEQALVIVTLSTATLVACVALLASAF
jgi:hypothetical protein